MAKLKLPSICPSCGVEGTLKEVGPEFVCGDKTCGQAFPSDPVLGLKSAPKRKASKKK